MYPIKDQYTLNLSDKDLKKIKDNMAQVTDQGLFARIAATHSGLVNRNNFFYLPDKMKKSVGTFLSPFQKPILVTHDESSEPIGRVVSARYVDTSLVLKDNISAFADKYSLSDVDFRKFLTGEMELMDQAEYIQDYLYDKMLSDPNFAGLGFAEIVSKITDKEAIEKFLDKRYLTGSVAAGTDHAICSICKDDWSSSEGRCEHTPGKMYDKKKAFLIAGNFTYEHWAVVNAPADGHSQVSEMSSLPLEDSVNQEAYTLGNISIELLDNYSEEEGMKVKDKKDTSQDSVKEVEDTKTEETTEKVEDKTEETSETEVADESFDELMTRLLDQDNKSSKEDLDKFYKLVEDELKEANLEDAELSAEQRKKLKKSAFCGPDRSFPVPDCAHVTAAKRLVNRYKGPGDKGKILDCVERKAKAMGCGSEKTEDEVQETPVDKKVEDAHSHMYVLGALLGVVRENSYADKEQQPLSEEQLGMLQELISSVASMVTKDDFSKVLLSEEVGLADKLNDLQDSTLLDEIVELETTIGSLRDELQKSKDKQQALKDQVTLSIKESELLRDSAILAKSRLREMKLDHLALLKSLQDSKVIQSSSLINLADTAIDSELQNFEEFDLSKITDKLQDGLTQNPTEVVENPMETVDNSQENETITEVDIKEELETIKDRYLELMFRDQVAANNYLVTEMKRLKEEGKLPEEG